MVAKKKMGKRRKGKGKKASQTGISRARSEFLIAFMDSTGLSLKDIRTGLMLLAIAPVLGSKKKGRKKARSS